jgi:hypothetical protein
MNMALCRDCQQRGCASGDTSRRGRRQHQLTSEIAMSLEVGVPIINDCPVYNFKTQLRLGVMY